MYLVLLIQSWLGRDVSGSFDTVVLGGKCLVFAAVEIRYVVIAMHNSFWIKFASKKSTE